MDEQTINQMFDLTYMNMSKIIPSATTKEEDYTLWRESFDKGRRSGTKHILYFRHDVLRGYISYTIRESSNDIYWNEIQIHSQSQGDSITFRKLLSQFLNEIEACKADTIVTYANNLNHRSQRLIQKAGFSIESETEKGVRYKISKTKLLRRLNHLRHNQIGQRNRAIREVFRTLRLGGLALVRTVAPEAVFERIPFRFFPQVAEIEAARLPALSDIKRKFSAAGFDTIRTEIVERNRELDLMEVINSLKRRSRPSYEVLTDDVLEKGLIKIRKEWGRQGNRLVDPRPTVFIVGEKMASLV